MAGTRDCVIAAGGSIFVISAGPRAKAGFRFEITILLVCVKLRPRDHLSLREFHGDPNVSFFAGASSLSKEVW